MAGTLRVQPLKDGILVDIEGAVDDIEPRSFDTAAVTLCSPSFAVIAYYDEDALIVLGLNPTSGQVLYRFKPSLPALYDLHVVSTRLDGDRAVVAASYLDAGVLKVATVECTPSAQTLRFLSTGFSATWGEILTGRTLHWNLGIATVLLQRQDPSGASLLVIYSWDTTTWSTVHSWQFPVDMLGPDGWYHPWGSELIFLHPTSGVLSRRGSSTLYGTVDYDVEYQFDELVLPSFGWTLRDGVGEYLGVHSDFDLRPELRLLRFAGQNPPELTEDVTIDPPDDEILADIPGDLLSHGAWLDSALDPVTKTFAKGWRVYETGLSERYLWARTALYRGDRFGTADLQLLARYYPDSRGSAQYAFTSMWNGEYLTVLYGRERMGDWSSQRNVLAFQYGRVFREAPDLSGSIVDLRVSFDQ